MTNYDEETRIHYGVIHCQHVIEMWMEKSIDVYENEKCKECGKEIVPFSSTCENCKAEIEEDVWEGIEPIGHEYWNGKYLMTAGDNMDVFVIKSPYYTWCRPCSSCTPNAGYIIDQTEEGEGIKTYCPGPRWYEDGVKVRMWKVENGE